MSAHISELPIETRLAATITHLANRVFDHIIPSLKCDSCEVAFADEGKIILIKPCEMHK